MKKSLIALAVLAASGAAMAQSSVTLYGIADVWVGSVKSETAGVSTRATSMISGGVSTSRWGMKGTEDLGGGLKANFQFEQGVNVDDGSTGAGFSRQAWVGLSGGFGDVRFGKVSSPYDNAGGASNAVFDSDLSPINNPGGAVFESGGYKDKVDNAIFYKTPSMGGIGAEFMYSLDEKGPTAVSVTGFNVTYSGGPLAAQLMYQEDDYVNQVNDQKFTRLGASYNFGIATAKVIFANVDNTNNTTGSTDEWMVGVDVPLSTALTLSASYASSEDDTAAGGQERDGFGVAAAYSLSKRTTVYGGVKKSNYDNVVGADTDYTVYAVGVKHTF